MPRRKRQHRCQETACGRLGRSLGRSSPLLLDEMLSNTIAEQLRAKRHYVIAVVADGSDAAALDTARLGGQAAARLRAGRPQRPRSAGRWQHRAVSWAGGSTCAFLVLAYCST